MKSAKKTIHSPYNKFKGWLCENGLTYADIAKTLGINVSTISLKINGQSDFLLAEVEHLKKEYNINNDIFL